MRCIIILLLLGLAGGCQHDAGGGAPGQAVTHAVIFYLKNPGDEQARGRIVETSKTFERIPGVVSVRAGRALPSTRPVVDSTYDVAVVVTFKDAKAMKEYETHPIHRDAVNGVLRELVARIVVYDFVNQ